MSLWSILLSYHFEFLIINLKLSKQLFYVFCVFDVFEHLLWRFLQNPEKRIKCGFYIFSRWFWTSTSLAASILNLSSASLASGTTMLFLDMVISPFRIILFTEAGAKALASVSLASAFALTSDFYFSNFIVAIVLCDYFSKIYVANFVYKLIM